jgi:hypothetical protein
LRKDYELPPASGSLMTVLHPFDWARLYELKKLTTAQERLQREGLPVPSWLSEKIASLQEKLS